MLKYVVCLCSGCDGCCVFCLYCDAWSCRCSCMGSVSVSSCRCCMFGGRSSAAFTHDDHPYLIRLSNNLSIMQAELAALSRGLHSPSRCVVFTGSKSAIQCLLHNQNDNVSLLMGIRDVASRMPTPPILTWIPSHIGIEGNEATDRAARQALLKPTIDSYLPLSKAKTRPLGTYTKHSNNLILRDPFSYTNMCPSL